MPCANVVKANPRLATLRDDDDRLPVHWALSNKHHEIVELLVQQKSFDPDVKDGSGWTPLMIAASLKEGEGLVQMLLGKGADVNAKSRCSVFQSPSHLDVALRFPSRCGPEEPYVRSHG